MKKKFSFLEKLTGGIRADDVEHEIEEIEEEISNHDGDSDENDSGLIESSGDWQLSVDVINNPSEIIIKSMVAGVKPQDLDIQISRDMVTIKGTREEEFESDEDDYYHKELFWGSFSRTIALPEEIDVDLAEAKEKHGLLILRLPKIDKARKTKLSVKSN